MRYREADTVKISVKSHVRQGKYVSRTITQEVQLLCKGSQLDNVTQEKEQCFVNAVKH